ncbi:TetR/AcrR family transcriptional regulator C-terminal domain-containing protein [Streptomyces ipomoeae]|uniref:TetR/AcrR family transcriptional regulator C-terminal domain-containing protein n=1 Tax=Streptomyces ipomoeae TaxID=103232 RepID=UPI001146ACD6|nr:TetR/AcrR family transcriptional regulator C-terminal domain-containing protein [Streptomyces ipomoeae]MDX2936982.1 TetR/AcrR family transcriptional regulator C-terminal domain-containing protein [Streptomyces ipomoeae]TQE20124.1 GntR family transcriptional regulator [Streptomyces ipomoeae]
MTQPPYARIAGELRRRIQAGELAPGDRVPSTRAITQRWGVAMATATKALTALRQEGLVRAVPGVGTVVADTAPQARSARSTAEDPTVRTRVVRAAMALADAEGTTALTMRRVAAELGIPTMSLYRHVANKEQLIALMVDAAFAGEPLPTRPPEGWRARLELSAAIQWRLYQAHPWLAAALNLSRPLLVPHGMRHIEWALSALDGLGLDADTRMHAAVTLFGYVRGQAIDTEPEARATQSSGITGEQWMDAQHDRMTALLTQGRLPHFASVADEAALSTTSLYEFGLTTLLDGLATRIRTARSPAAR